MAERQQRVLGPDGLGYGPKQNEKLDDLAVATFGRGAGREFLRYLRSITIEMVGGPQITDAELRHREGARYVVGIIEARLKAGVERRSKSNGTPQ